MSSSHDINICQVFSQIKALMRRYYLNQTFNYIRNTIKFLIWPGVLLIIAMIILIDFDCYEGTCTKINYEGSISKFCIFLFAFHIWSFSEWLVIDKTSEMKSLMYSMGLRKSSYYMGNILIFLFFIVGPLSIIVLIISKNYMFIDKSSYSSSWIELSLIYLLFSIQLTSFTFAISSIIISNNFLIFIPITILLQLPIHMIIKLAVLQVGNAFSPLIIVIALMSPFEALSIYADSYESNRNFRGIFVWYDYEQKLIWSSTNFLFIMMVLWSGFFFVFSYSMDEFYSQWKHDEQSKINMGCWRYLCSKLKKICPSKTQNQEPQSRNSTLVDCNDKRMDKSFIGGEIYFEKEEPRRLDSVEIQLNNVSKAFDKTIALDDVSFNIYKNETTVLLGQYNKSSKAGKTTLINLLLNNKLKPQKGYIVFNKNKPAKHDKKGHTGFCPQTSILDPKLNVKQHLELFIDIKLPGLSFIEKKCNVMNTIEYINLNRHHKMFPSQLSNGLKRKLNIAIAFVGRSDFIILDEPTIDLDIHSKISIRNFIKKYKKNKTILLTSQLMEEADYLGDRIAIMSQGKIISIGSSLFLNNIFSGNCYKLLIECYRNEQKVVSNLVKEYFSQSTLSNLSEKLIPTSMMMYDDHYNDESLIAKILIELIDDRKSKDELEISLINLLVFIENNSSDLHGIISFNLICSNIEDLIISKHTSNKKTTFSQTEEEIIEQQLQTNNNLNDIIDIISNPKKEEDYDSNFTNIQKPLLYAFLVKHLQTYRNNMISIIFFRLILSLFSVIAISFEFHFRFATENYSPALMNAFLIVHFIVYPTLEKESKFKIIQLTSEANIILYWLSLLLIDLLSIFILVIYFNSVFAVVILNNGYYLKNEYLVHFVLSISTLLFGISGSLIAYILSIVLVAKPFACMGYSLLLYWTSPFINMITGATRLSIFKFIHDIFDTIFILIFPTDAFQFIRQSFISNCYVKIYGLESNNCSGLIDTVAAILFGVGALIFQILIYGTVLYLIEYRGYLKVGKARRRINKEGETKKHIITTDEDVIEESAKAALAIKDVDSSQLSDYSLIVSDLSKSKRINNLSFTISKRGECFGLIGSDIVEKNTIFSILTGEIMPDDGLIWCNNSNEAKSYMKNIGYAPQINPIIYLTPNQALCFIAKLRRIHRDNIQLQVDSMLKLFHMFEYKDKKVSTLKGGLKRKLTLAMSLIGSPTFLALNEPTYGIDLASKNNLWLLLKSLQKKNNTSILISTNELKDLDLVCDRIGIMSKGSLECVGTFFHLNSKFNSNGCRLKVYFIQTDKELVEQLINELRAILESKIFGKIDGKKLHYKNIINGAIFELSNEEASNKIVGYSKSKLLEVLREFRINQTIEIRNKMFYTLNDHSLEDLISNLAQEELNSYQSNDYGLELEGTTTGDNDNIEDNNNDLDNSFVTITI